jgi:hypothetical protein
MSEQEGDKVNIPLSTSPRNAPPLHEILRRTFQIDGHLGTNVVLCDEPPKWYTDAPSADKSYDKVQETKNVFTQHQHNRSVLKMEEHIRTSQNGDEP